MSSRSARGRSGRNAPSHDFLSSRLDAFLDELAAERPAPGGGSAAAIAVAMGASLVAMAARLSRGTWSEAGGAVAQAAALRARLAPLAHADAEVYEEALRALEAPAELKPEMRDRVLGEALWRAADVPLAIAEAGADVAALAAAVAERGDPSVRGDAAAGALLAEAGARAAANLVAINLGATARDPRVVRARSLVAAATASARPALEA